MQSPERKFVGGIKKVTPRNIYERGKVDSQRTEIFGLNQDFINRTFALATELIPDYKDNPTKKNLDRMLRYISGAKTYTQYLRHRGATPKTEPALFAEDILPYNQALDEIILDIKKLGRQAEEESRVSFDPSKLKPIVLLLEERASTVQKIIQSNLHRSVSTYSYKNKLSTDPMLREVIYKKGPLPESEAIEKITKRLLHGKKVLAGGPLKESFSQIMDNGDVLPVDWEPKDKDKENLRGSGRKES